MFSYAL